MKRSASISIDLTNAVFVPHLEDARKAKGQYCEIPDSVAGCSTTSDFIESEGGEFSEGDSRDLLVAQCELEKRSAKENRRRKSDFLPSHRYGRPEVSQVLLSNEEYEVQMMQREVYSEQLKGTRTTSVPMHYDGNCERLDGSQGNAFVRSGTIQSHMSTMSDDRNSFSVHEKFFKAGSSNSHLRLQGARSRQRTISKEDGANFIPLSSRYHVQDLHLFPDTNIGEDELLPFSIVESPSAQSTPQSYFHDSLPGAEQALEEQSRKVTGQRNSNESFQSLAHSALANHRMKLRAKRDADEMNRVLSEAIEDEKSVTPSKRSIERMHSELLLSMKSLGDLVSDVEEEEYL